MKLNILPLGQRDPKWASNKLGNSTSLTIGSDGCLLVCHAMMLGYFGHEFTPDALNEVYKSKKVFDNALINFYAAGAVFEDFTSLEYYNCIDIPCDLTKIDKLLAERQPVIAYVDNINGDGKPDHFVLIIGKTDDGHYFTNDPWTAETYYFDAKWGDPTINIYGLRIYKGTPKVVYSPEDKIRDLEDKVKSLNEQVANLSLENNALRTDLSTQEADNSDLADQLRVARGEKDSLAWQIDQLNIKIKTLEETIEKQKGAISDQLKEIDMLKSDLVASQDNNLIGFTFWDFIRLMFKK